MRYQLRHSPVLALSRWSPAVLVCPYRTTPSPSIKNRGSRRGVRAARAVAVHNGRPGFRVGRWGSISGLEEVGDPVLVVDADELVAHGHRRGALEALAAV